ncbi:TetR/AcrR family transcriptional regulator [Mycolicibacterium rhodesiae]|uniref:TetR family transcriptional regulator n=1 Tax=Mycolicibacterium rhodesiae TaxID=36814 RepID=A0A1X0IVR7_MYCRH|nr:TetR/AcrR family transcriptional regulator [Mycolicibacterium rhodesiae]MCV7343211.1 TetR/AcrR family transcriptional regulator [Mycolicibacterium rhodesiae]ORB53107.1 TetR family transcriptional regulator [Mycolicibacterium rhodesiae]
MHTRERILQAAAEMIGEDVTTTLSVRAVASRAGVSTGSLRFHFPTQRALQDEVLTRIYQHFIPDDPIRDSARPARDRLVDCLRQVLAAAGVGDEARKAWGAAYQSFIAPEPNDKIRTAYLAHERASAGRVEYWLGVLADEGALPRKDFAKKVQFVLTVLNGLSVQRALPSGESVLQSETETLYTAVDAVLGSGSP